MKSIYKLIAVNILIVISLLLLLETYSYISVYKRQPGLGFFVNIGFAKNKSFKVVNDNQYNQIDPLLGYSKTEEKLKSQGFNVDHGFVILSTSADTINNIRILITGGSTTDVSLNSHNWPVYLATILKEHQIKATLYVAAVGGYNSGQELLSLVRDGLNVKPQIHISYSGANEVSPTYISSYEDDFYATELLKGHSYWLMPNTVFILRNLLGLNHVDVCLKPNIRAKNDQFWERNMGIMEGTSITNHYRFLGLLQPVFNSGTYRQESNGYDPQIKLVTSIYPSLKEAAKRHPEFITDLTGIFDTCHGKVFGDQCHIYDAYQPVVAENIYNALVDRDLLPK